MLRIRKFVTYTKICYVSQGKDGNFFDIKELHFLSSSYKLFTAKSSSINNQATGQMNINFIIVMCAACVSSARLGFNGSKYHYSQFRNLSPQQAAIIKHLLKQKCLRKYGPRFCWFSKILMQNSAIFQLIPNFFISFRPNKSKR